LAQTLRERPCRHWWTSTEPARQIAQLDAMEVDERRCAATYDGGQGRIKAR
jgi:hypothetical protein